MARTSKIDWTDQTLNAITGCTPISPGCDHCYAQKMTRRLKAMGQEKYQHGFQVTVHPATLSELFLIKEPQRVFMNSMSDTFHANVPLAFIQDMFQAMGQNPHLTFQVLTKRADRMAALAPQLTWYPNIWAGVTVENQDHVFRMDFLRQVPARRRFVSYEPLISSINDLDLSGIHWGIVGGETGPGCRPMDLNWARSIRDQHITAGIPFFYKNGGGIRNKVKTLDGQAWHQFP